MVPQSLLPRFSVLGITRESIPCFPKCRPPMAPMNLSQTRSLAPGQAADLLQLLELQAHWQLTTETALPPGSSYSTQDLHRRQRTFEEFRAKQQVYCGVYKTTRIPDPCSTHPSRFRAWCEMILALIDLAEPKVDTVHLIASAYRAADTIAKRSQRPLLDRSPATPDALRNLDVILAWCDGMPAVVHPE